MRERMDAFERLSVLDRAAMLVVRLWEDLKALSALLVVWQQRARERHHLARLDERLLKDVGLSRADVEREWRKPFWLQ